MVALWHTNARGNLKALIKLFGAHWDRLVTLTGHSNKAKMIGVCVCHCSALRVIDESRTGKNGSEVNVKQCDRLLRVIVRVLIELSSTSTMPSLFRFR